jgi:hypothetical protein
MEIIQREKGSHLNKLYQSIEDVEDICISFESCKTGDWNFG